MGPNALSAQVYQNKASEKKSLEAGEQIKIVISKLCQTSEVAKWGFVC